MHDAGRRTMFKAKKQKERDRLKALEVCKKNGSKEHPRHIAGMPESGITKILHSTREHPQIRVEKSYTGNI